MIHVIIYCDSLCFVILGMDKIFIQASASSHFLRLTFHYVYIHSFLTSPLPNWQFLVSEHIEDF